MKLAALIINYLWGGLLALGFIALAFEGDFARMEPAEIIAVILMLAIVIFNIVFAHMADVKKKK